MTGEQYKDALKSLGLFQHEAAMLLGVSERTSRRYAAGRDIPATVAYTLRMAVRFRVSPVMLFEEFGD